MSFRMLRLLTPKSEDAAQHVVEGLGQIVSARELVARLDHPALDLGDQRRAPLLAHGVALAFNYMLRRWSSFTRFLDDGRICLSNNAAERALRGIALGRKSWLFCGSDRGGQRAAVLYSLIVSAKMNDIDPQAWLTDVLARLPAYPAHRIDDLLPWNWRSAKLRTQPAAA